MKKLLAALTVLSIISSCGGSLQSSSGAPSQINTQNTERSYLVFDPFSKSANQPLGIPFPNDIFWASQKRGETYVSLDTSSVSDPAEKLLFEAINQLHIKGLSPNTPIFIPLSSNEPLEMASLNGKFLLVDLTVLRELSQAQSDEEKAKLIPLLIQSNRLYVSQDGRYLKFYPVNPLRPAINTCLSF